MYIYIYIHPLISPSSKEAELIKPVSPTSKQLAGALERKVVRVSGLGLMTRCFGLMPQCLGFRVDVLGFRV